MLRKKWVPWLGIDTDRFIEDPHDRQEQGLHAQPVEETPDGRGEPKLDISLTVATMPGQTIIAPGRATVREEEGRRVFDFGLRQAVPLHLAIASADYVTTTRVVDGVTLSVSLSGGHDANLDRLISGAADALADYSERFAPYPHDQLTIAEIPSFSDSFAATAYPQTVYVVENRVVLLEHGPEQPDLAYRCMAHEVAHQWWGNLLEPAHVPGFRILTEVLSEYSEMVVYGKRHGEAANRAVLESLIDLYFFMRGFASEPEQPLVVGEDQAYATYFKGAHSVHVLRELMGEATIDAVLRELLADFPYPAAPRPEDLITRLEAALPREQRPVIDELFREVVTHEVRLGAARLVDSGDGEVLELEIIARQTRLDDEGIATLEPLGRPLEIVLVRDGETIAREVVALDGTTTTITLEPASRPDTVVLDPRILFLETERGDNRMALERERDR